MAAIESLMYCDYSLSIKAGVHFTLCGGTICKLGTKKHHDLYLDGLDDLSLTGSFSMTELGEILMHVSSILYPILSGDIPIIKYFASETLNTVNVYTLITP
jgi:hypothetical protein